MRLIKLAAGLVAALLLASPAGALAAVVKPQVNYSGILQPIKATDTAALPALQVTGGTTDVQQDVRFSGDISPSQITSQEDNYNPTGLSAAAVLRLSTDASRNLTGLQGGADGRLLTIVNVGSFDIVLKDESASSSAAHRFALDQDLTLQADTAAVLGYDATTSRWRLRGVGKAAGGGVSDGDKGDISISSGGATYTVDNDAITYAKIQNVGANSVLARAASTSGDLSELALAACQFLGRGSTGDVAAISVGTNLSCSGATLNASVSSTGLADYDFGTWTPTLTFGGGSTSLTYGTRVGLYFRVGRFVFVTMHITLTNKGSSTGTAVISGLPYAANTTTGAWQVTQMGAASSSGLNGWIGYLGIAGGVSNTAFAVGNNLEQLLTHTTFTNTTDMIGTFGYLTD